MLGIWVWLPACPVMLNHVMCVLHPSAAKMTVSACFWGLWLVCVCMWSVWMNKIKTKASQCVFEFMLIGLYSRSISSFPTSFKARLFNIWPLGEKTQNKLPGIHLWHIISLYRVSLKTERWSAHVRIVLLFFVHTFCTYNTHSKLILLANGGVTISILNWKLIEMSFQFPHHPNQRQNLRFSQYFFLSTPVPWMKSTLERTHS